MQRPKGQPPYRPAADGYPKGWPQPAGAMTYRLNGTQVGRGNILNIAGSGITATPLDDGITYNISGGGSGGGVVFGDPATGYNPNEIIYVDNSGNLYGDVRFTRDQFSGDTTIGGDHVELGDTTGIGNGTKLLINDSSRSIILQNTANISIGDPLGAGNAGYFSFDDSVQQALLQNLGSTRIGDATGSGIRLEINPNVAEASIFTPSGTFWAGDKDGYGNFTYIRVYDGASNVIINGYKIVAQSAVSFTGTGPDDLTPSDPSVFQGQNGATMQVIITVKDGQRLTYDPPVGGDFNVGDAIVGATSGAMGTVYENNGSDQIIIESLTGTFVTSEVINDTTSGASANTLAVTTVSDFYTLNTSFSGVFTGLQCVTIGGPSFFGITVNFSSETGHNLGDQWDWSYIVSIGQMLSLNGANGLMQMGDVNGVGNSTILAVNDNTQKVSFNFGTDSIIFPTGHGAAGQTFIDDGAGNLSWGSVASGSITDTQIGYGNALNQLTSDVNFIRNITDDRFSFASNINTSNGIFYNGTGAPNPLGNHAGLGLDFRAGSILTTLGWVGIGGGTHLEISDANVRTDLYTQDFYIRGYNNNIVIFSEITNTFSDVVLGDVSGAYTTTKLSVLDSIAGVKMSGVFGDSLFADMSVNYVVSLGALGVGNSTKVVIDDTSGVTSVTGGNVSGGGLLVQDAALANWLKVDVSNAVHTTTIGDISSVGNDTLLIVNDINKQIIADSATGDFFAGDYNNVANSTLIILQDDISKISLQGTNLVLGFTQTQFNGNLRQPSIVQVSYGSTTDYSANGTFGGHSMIQVSGSTGATTILLPTGTTALIGTIITIKDHDCIASTSNITVDAGTSSTIKGSSSAQTFVMNQNGQSLTLIKVTSNSWDAI